MVGGIETGLGLRLAVGEGSLDTTHGDHHNRALSVTHTHIPALLPTLLPPTPFNLFTSELIQRLRQPLSKSKGTGAGSITGQFDRHQWIRPVPKPRNASILHLRKTKSLVYGCNYSKRCWPMHQESKRVSDLMSKRLGVSTRAPLLSRTLVTLSHSEDTYL